MVRSRTIAHDGGCGCNRRVAGASELSAPGPICEQCSRSEERRSRKHGKTGAVITMAEEENTGAESRSHPGRHDPHHTGADPIQAPGHTQVDFGGARQIFARLTTDYRPCRVWRRLLAGFRLARCCRSTAQISATRPVTVIASGAPNKLTRYSLLNAAPASLTSGISGRRRKHHRLYAPCWHQDHCRSGLLRHARARWGTDLVCSWCAEGVKFHLDAEGVGDYAAGPGCR